MSAPYPLPMIRGGDLLAAYRWEIADRGNDYPASSEQVTSEEDTGTIEEVLGVRIADSFRKLSRGGNS